MLRLQGVNSEFLPKKGNSNTKERIELLEKFIQIFGVEKIDRLLGDREFIGETWFAYLSTHQSNFAYASNVLCIYHGRMAVAHQRQIFLEVFHLEHIVH